MITLEEYLARNGSHRYYRFQVVLKNKDVHNIFYAGINEIGLTLTVFDITYLGKLTPDKTMYNLYIPDDTGDSSKDKPSIFCIPFSEVN